MSTKKKAKRNKKKTKAPPPSVPSSLDAMAELSLSSTTTTTVATTVCYHGSTAEKFFPGSDYLKAIRDHFLFSLKMNKWKEHLDEGTYAVRPALQTEIDYIKDLPHLVLFAFAYATHLFLNFNDTRSRRVVEVLLTHGIRIKYHTVPSLQVTISGDYTSEKYYKYCRDAVSGDRGIINCLARETKDFCDCMKQKKVEAHDMVKRGRCDGCWGLFPKDQLLECKGCHVDRYHSKECQTNDWPKHRLRCKAVQENQKKLAANEE